MGHKVIVVDVQPAYARYIGDIEPYMEYLNKAGSILALFNGPEMGMDSEEDILEWWIENGFDPEKQWDITWEEKGYGFFRDWMDAGFDDEMISEAVRYMLDNRKYDSRDIEAEEWAEIFDEDTVEEITDSGESIGLPHIDLNTLRRFSGASLIGGGCQECLAEVLILLNALKQSYREERRYIYAKTPLTGYKSVALVKGKYRSLYDNSLIPGRVHSTHAPPGGVYLGTTEQFVRDYYTGMTDEDEIILVYEYDPRDVVSGNPQDSEGEVKVQKAKLTGTIRVASATRVAARYLRATTTPLPSKLPKSEIGLMTQGEFLQFRNKGDKSHPSDAYDYDFEKINYHSDLTHVHTTGRWQNAEPYRIFKGQGGYIIEDEDGRLAAIIHNGTLYHGRKNQSIRDIPLGYRDTRYHQDGGYIDFGVKRFKLVKYLAEYMPLVNDRAATTRKRFPTLLQRIKVGDEYMELRSEGPPKIDNHTDLAILNEEGMVVARGQDEWGATLIIVAEEYRGKKLGQIIGKYWYKFNPNSVSGGFTAAGKANAIKLWAKRVREISAWGWFSELYKQGRLTKERINEILAGLGERKVFKEEPAKKPTQKQILVYVDDPTFVVYDSRFLDDPHAEDSDKYIVAYGYMGSDTHKGVYFFRLEYERAYHKLATYVGLQMARDSGDPLYNGEGYSDVLELEGLDHIQQDGDYVSLTKDVIPLKQMGRLEKTIRKQDDRYGEKKTLLLEQADAKWR